MLCFPVHFVGERLAPPTRAPTVGEHTEEVLRELLGCDEARVDAIRASGALGPRAKPS
jgi:crotonobetainyl-CoA:carnitine CoA-transferase CaiB-like acyl-CoA transferase